MDDKKDSSRITGVPLREGLNPNLRLPRPPGDRCVGGMNPVAGPAAPVIRSDATQPSQQPQQPTQTPQQQQPSDSTGTSDGSKAQE
jgi:hypothetical protein